jgi:hypothetical protein
MTVAELIAVLRDQPADAEVMFTYGSPGIAIPVAGANPAPVRPYPGTTGRYAVSQTGLTARDRVVVLIY